MVSHNDEGILIEKVAGVEHGVKNATLSTALAKQVDASHANPNGQIQKDSFPAHLAGTKSDIALVGEQTHGDWLVVTRKKRNKPKNQRVVKANDKDRISSTPTVARANVKDHVMRPVEGKVTQQVDNVIKRGTGKRSRQEGKHATPTHILLRNAGVKDLSKESHSPFKDFIQQGNFGASVPNLFKDVEGMPPPGGKVDKDKANTESLSMDYVPETQFVFDPGQTKFNEAAFT
ncbi:hypothetical protein RIF29_15951 [Crotalaria pallida]|uniref:Uncharacterized protein n=1 Tax=Crotalaria pallida TaxID=3830 RepID=A0AAN9ID26_CROPI